MNKPLLTLPILTLLTGCPNSNHEGAEIGTSRGVYISSEVVCFSVDKNDLLTRYNLYSNENGDKQLAVGESVKLKYPKTCINVHLKKGYQYSASYNLNNMHYHYEFFIDNNWNVVGR
jgi:hypothetical protein